MPYDRDAALSYARQYWLTPASDGYIAGAFDHQPFMKVPDGTVFVHDTDPGPSEHALLPDGTVIGWKPLDDCTHFISCVVGEPGGGLAVPRDFPSGPYGILGADRFVHALLNHGLVEVIPVADKSAPGLDRIAPGDILGYFRRSRSSYAHLVLYAGDENIICHTYCRSDDPACTWDHGYALGHDNADWEWRLIRVRDR
jgi:hypothetical protein